MKYEQQIFNPPSWSQPIFFSATKIKEIQLKIKHLKHMQIQRRTSGLFKSVIRIQKEISALENLLDGLTSVDEHSLEIPWEIFHG